MEKVKDKFLRYVAVDTQSADGMEQVPSTEKQFHLAKMLCAELQAMGAENVRMDEEHAYVYAFLPGNTEQPFPAIGLIAHMDTSPAMSGKNVRPRCIPDYDGKDICLNRDKDIWMKVEDFPALVNYTGKELIVTDGTTLLGADDKAGVAEIMTMAEMLLTHPEISHRPVAIGFTPDEEVGRGVDFFDIPNFGAKEAYTVDGGALGGIEYETFNAASAQVTINGKSIHPGDAKNKMRNAMRVAFELDALLPEEQRPEHTEGYEGFYHLDRMEGTVESARMDYILRDHDRSKFEAKKTYFAACCNFLNEKYGEGTVLAEIKDTYYNLKDALSEHMDLIERACDAMRAVGVEPVISPIRGGTDGCHLSYAGLPCPNLCTGGHNYHGKYEYIVRESMEKVVELLLTLAKV
ncbi:MAG: peptidase T [Oscillospiraceae bacterium]|nr:peptidase T [Oscillospiraceae bacterium]